MHRPIDVAVVGDRRRTLPDLLQVLGQLVDIASAVQQGVIGMQMQVRKFSDSHLLSLLLSYLQPLFHNRPG